MRRSLALFTLFLVLGIGNSKLLAEQEFPYSATIVAETADVHSGPGATHYATCQLTRGSQVEVFRRDPDGWLAIRPAENEFSLVLAKYVLANFREGLGRVSSDGVQAWVGSLLPQTAEPLWQVQFRKGEVVRIIGDTRVEDASGQTHLWYRIAPPAGEFRWIHESAFQRSGQAEIARSHEQETNSSEQQFISQSSAAQPIEASLANAVQDQTAFVQNNNSGSIVPKPFQPEQIDTADVTGGSESIRGPARSQQIADRDPAPQPISSKVPSQGDWIVASDAGTTSRASAHPAAKEHAAPDSSANNQATISKLDPVRQPESDNSVQTIPLASRAEQTTVTEQLRETEIQLTLAALQPADQWQLETVRKSVMEISRQARSEAERVQVNSLLEKINAFEKLKKRYEAANRNALQIRNPRAVSPANRKAAASDRPAPLSESSSGNLFAQASNTGERSTEIPEQTNGVQPIGTGVDESSTGLLPATFEQVSPATSSVETEPEATEEGLDNVAYDAQGWLNRLYQADGQGAMGYVVQDKSGKILKTILPAPGVNLDRYLEQEVGIFGRRGFNVKYNLPHVTADHVILLERHR